MFTLVCCQEHRSPVSRALFPGGIQGQWQSTPSALAIPTQKPTVLNPQGPMWGGGGCVSGVFGPLCGDQEPAGWLPPATGMLLTWCQQVQSLCHT